MKYLLDTDTLSFVARGQHPELTRRVFDAAPDTLAISVVTFGEAEFGLSVGRTRRETERRMRSLLAHIQCLPLTVDVAAEYGALRSALHQAGTPIGPNDLWIAAHACCLQLTLVTHNSREFSRVARLKIEDWLA